MKLLLTTTHQDRSRYRLSEEAQRKGLEVSLLYYEDLAEFFNEDSIKGHDYAILRDPYNTGQDYSGILRRILRLLPEDRVLDFLMYASNPDYEDKLCQQALYSGLMDMPRNWHFEAIDAVTIQQFPVT